jgi:hypothetical protein
LRWQNKTLNEEDPWSSFLAATVWAIRSIYHTTLRATPTQLVFGCDMILNIKFKSDWAIINAQKQSRTEKETRNKNAKRIPHQYKVGDRVLVDVASIRQKLGAPRHRPYKITDTFTNGTVRIQCGIVNNRINICCVTPFTER